MSRNEIRLRRHRMTASGADRFRNYNDVLERHQKDQRIKRIIRAFIMFMILLALVAAIFLLSRIEKGEVSFDTHSSPVEMSSTHSVAYSQDQAALPLQPGTTP